MAKHEIETTRAKVRDLIKAMDEKRKPSESRPPPRAIETARNVAEGFTPNGTHRVIGFNTGRNR